MDISELHEIMKLINILVALRLCDEPEASMIRSNLIDKVTLSMK